jgi:hypothetical protein
MFEQPHLSPAGQQRREDILRLAQAHAKRQRLRRKVVPSAVVIAFALFFAAVTVIQWHTGFRPAIVVNPVPIVNPVPVIAGPAVAPEIHPLLPVRKSRQFQIVVTLVKTESGLADRLAIHPQSRPELRHLSDDELLQQLANAGRPAALAWIDGRETLIFSDGGTKAGLQQDR